MNRTRLLSWAMTFAAVLILASWAGASTEAESQKLTTAPQVTPEQQKQLDQLAQLEQQLAKNRAAVREAIAQYGVDSDQADAAQEQLFRDRTEDRKLRRSLRAAGVPVPAPQSIGPGPMRQAGRGGRGMRGSRGMCQCPCPCAQM